MLRTLGAVAVIGLLGGGAALLHHAPAIAAGALLHPHGERNSRSSRRRARIANTRPAASSFAVGCARQTGLVAAPSCSSTAWPTTAAAGSAQSSDSPHADGTSSPTTAVRTVNPRGRPAPTGIGRSRIFKRSSPPFLLGRSCCWERRSAPRSRSRRPASRMSAPSLRRKCSQTWRQSTRERAPSWLPAWTIRDAFDVAEDRGRFRVASVSPEAAAARSVRAPVLFLHGERDADTSPAHTQRVYRALGGPKRMLMVEGAGHNQSLQSSAVGTRSTAWIDDS